MARFNYDIRRRKQSQWAARWADIQLKLHQATTDMKQAQAERDHAQRKAYIAEQQRQAFARDVKLTPEALKFSIHVIATMGENELLRIVLREVVSRWDDKMHRAIMDVARQARTLAELREVLSPWVTLEGFESWEVWR